MRIGCGAVKTKTPLLTSKVVRMDLNPQWIVPKSIAKGIAYSYSYMQKERMFIFDKTRGKLPCTESSLERILSGEQYIIQKGGEGNSLGRIIFRFPNNFSVYLHDTNTPWMLQRDFRAISHGCIRVERPFELAEFMLEKKEQSVIDKIHDTTTKDSISRSISISPEVPIYITYYTFYPNESNVLQSYPDVYGYDEAIFERLKAFIKE
jgi:murein L,D-transpeptidase YcbB/YkuD